MGVRIQELPETTGINKEDVLIVEDGQGTKKGTVKQLDEALGVSQLKEDIVDLTHTRKIKYNVNPTVIDGKRLYLNQTSRPTVIEVDDTYGNYLSLSVNAGEKYLFSGRFTVYISGIFFLDKNDFVLSYDHYNTSTENVTDYVVNIPNDCVMLKITYSNSQSMTLKKETSKIVPNIGGSKNVIIVDANGYGDFDTIVDACNNANNGDTILVYPGVYEEQVNIYGKELYIVGVNKYACILKDSSSDYRTPPLQANWGGISNMTIIEDASNPPSGIDDIVYDGHPVKNMAYCIHSDNGTNIWTTTHTEFVVENCILENANRPCIGAGLYPYHTLKVINCEMHSGIGVVTNYKRGCLYFHNNQSTSGVMEQGIIIKDNIVKCDDEVSLYASDTQGTGTCNCELINNTFYSAINGVSPSSIYNQMNKTNENFKLLETCHGNNIGELNY